MNGETQRIIDLEQTHVVQTYRRPPFVLEHGEGVMLYDTEGKAYLDFVAGIAVNALGYGDPELAAVIQGAAGQVLHVSNLYHTKPHAELAAKLCALSFADRVFFANSGTEANEAAVKFARKVAHEKGETDRKEIVCFSDAFHGRTMGSLALTPKPYYQEPFKPLMPGVQVGRFNDLDSALALINAHTAAVIVEPVQGEGGVNPATPEFLRGLRELCDANGALLILDEIQCGVGRTGTLWAYEQYGITPDILTAAKPLAGGLPIGAVLVTEAVASALKPGDHGSTFAGGLMVTQAAQVVLNRVSQPEFLAHVQATSEYLLERLSEINSPLIKEVRGKGLMIGVELTVEAAPLMQKGFEQGVLMVIAGPKVLRLVPPLILEKAHVDIFIEKLTLILSEAVDG